MQKFVLTLNQGHGQFINVKIYANVYLVNKNAAMSLVSLILLKCVSQKQYPDVQLYLNTLS